MKKIFSLFAAVLFAGSMMAETYSFTFAKGELTTSTTEYTHDEVTWTLSNPETQWNGTAGKTGYVFGTASAPVTLVVSTSGIEGTITKVSVTGRSNNKNKTAVVSVKVGSADFTGTGTSWDNGDNQTAVFTGSAAGAIAVTITPDACGLVLAGIAVEYTPSATAVAKPTFSVSAGTYTEAQSVELACTTEGAKIYYTTDGTDPTSASTEYTAAIALNDRGTYTIKAIAIKGEDKSSIASATYVLNLPYVFTSLEDLVAADLASDVTIEVTFENVLIDSVFIAKTTSKRQGLYLNVLDKTGKKDIELYYNKDEVPTAWKEGGKVSGTIAGTWSYYAKGEQWEIVPAGDSWKWTELTYKAPREVVTAVSFTGFDGFFKVGMTWNSSAESDLWLGIQPGEGTGNWWQKNMQVLSKWNEATEQYEDVDSDPGTVLTAGKYIFYVQIRIEGTDAQTKRLPKKGETPNMTVTVDGVNWPYTNGAVVYDEYSYDWIVSPEFTLVDDPTGVEDVMNGKVSTKVLRDGVLIIERDGVRYNVLGEIVR